MTYAVQVIDLSGTPAHDVRCADFAECLAVVWAMASRCPDPRTHVVDVANLAECDGNDGLTDDEREHVVGAVNSARKKSA